MSTRYRKHREGKRSFRQKKSVVNINNPEKATICISTVDMKNRSGTTINKRIGDIWLEAKKVADFSQHSFSKPRPSALTVRGKEPI